MYKNFSNFKFKSKTAGALCERVSSTIRVIMWAGHDMNV